ncbi:MAG: hypothetical protein ABIA67_02720 [Candidatus Margulisiibacteriota bacterium]
MKKLANIALIVAAISFVIGAISRLTLIPIPIAGIEAQALLQFTNTALLAAIALVLLEK